MDYVPSRFTVHYTFFSLSPSVYGREGGEVIRMLHTVEMTKRQGDAIASALHCSFGPSLHAGRRRRRRRRRPNLLLIACPS